MRFRRAVVVILGLVIFAPLLVASSAGAAAIPCSRQHLTNCPKYVTAAPTATPNDGSVTDNYHWQYNQGWYYGYTVNGNSVLVGIVQGIAHISLNGRQVRWDISGGWGYSGPAVATDNEWNCVDHHAINTSCSGGWQSKVDEVGGTLIYTTGCCFESAAQYYLSNNGAYWMNFQWFWSAQGYGGTIWDTPELTSNMLTCQPTRTAACQF